MIEIIKQCDWEIHWGGIGNPRGGIEGKVTHCRALGWEFYIRENHRPRGGHFMVTAGERMGWKTGTSVSRRHDQVLELACPPKAFEELAALVHEVDGLHRPVLRNARFTMKTARSFFVEKASC